MTATAVAVREHPILFSAEMVRAILDGRKSQTRRVVAPKHAQLFRDLELPEARNVRVVEGGITFDWLGGIASVRAPNRYGVVGDRLWVRENLRERMSGDGPIWVYEADQHEVTLDEDDPRVGAMISWAYDKATDYCPSIHMPRWASRITLEITSVRVERLQAITPQDAVAEGIEAPGLGLKPVRDAVIDRYRELWDSLNSDRGYGWDMNPWVWVIEFKRVTP